MRFGYNTNGFAHHRVEDALEILAELGYGSVAITLDYHALNPFDPHVSDQVNRIHGILERSDLHSVIETGARFLLNPRRKHQPTLVSPSPEERERRLDFLKRAVDIAADLQSHAVSFWSGVPLDEVSAAIHWDRLTEGCHKLCDYAETRDVRLAFEPEPGMLVDTMERFAELHRRVNHPLFGLTLDVGHVHCLGDGSVPERILEWKDWLWNVHIEDMRRGVHDHLFFGEGDMEFPPIFAALNQIEYRGGIHVELSRHSHDAVNTARRAMRKLESFA